ncbi:MFS transporter [Stigmatella aurantiaca]|uniref:Major facilitator superfamily MFS-1 family protein n=1 Tax=Stigmatella aurantiaca (strain DW4/3-1) TaxID=378806 RepID=E3FQV0_STIAD|nr:MFS transporter [Stigmatella aurantiaca]ADO71983.1 Major facilitator superfamily MFS-1 family protein [Stigmatella aurantiaca DW4/3-1]
MDISPASAPTASLPSASLRTFVLVWAAQTVSLIGSQLTAFGLAVWVYQRTGSTTLHALVAVANMAPRTLFVLLLGGLADRWNLRKLLLASQIGSGLCAVLLALLAGMDQLGVAAVLALVAANAVFGSVQPPALTKLTTLLVPSRQLGRANGLNQFGFALGYILSPLLASMLLEAAGLLGILIIDGITFALAVAVMAAVSIQDAPSAPTNRATSGPREPLWKGAWEGWMHVYRSPGLLGLVFIFVAMNFNLGILRGLVTPLVLSFSDVRAVGNILFTGGIGMLLGSVAMMVWGGPRRRIVGVLGFFVVQGLSLFAAAWAPSVVLVAVSAFGVLLSFPIIQSCGVTIMQNKVPKAILGRVHSASSSLAGGGVLLAYLVAGPLADQVFEPLMTGQGALATQLGPFLGTGPGRGIALLFGLIGLETVAVALLGALRPSIRLMEDRLPDQSLGTGHLSPSSPSPSA